MFGSNKTKILEEIKQCQEKLDQMFSKINKFDAILVLLSYREAMNNELNFNGRQRIVNKEYDNIGNVLAFHNILQMIYFIEELLNKFLHDSQNEFQELEISPTIETFFSDLPKLDPIVQEWAFSRGNPEEDFWSADEMQIPGIDKIVYRHFIIYKFFILNGKEQIKQTLQYLALFARLKSLESVITNAIPATLSDDSPFFSEFGISLEEKLRLSDIHPRTLATNAPSFPSYKENVHKIGVDTIKSTDMKANSPTQQMSRKEEHFSFFEEFLMIPQFPSEFKSKTGITLKDFSVITNVIKEIAIRRDNAVGIESKNRLVIKIKKICGLDRKTIQKTINYLLVTKNDRIKEKCIIESNSNYFFSWTMVTLSCNKVVSKIYDIWVDDNSKGILFEEDCKQIFKKRKLVCNSKRILIKKRIIPENISEKLWNKIKNWGELDVVGIQEKILFIIECKSEFPKLKKSNRQMNFLAKYYEELWYKSKWISENMDEFKIIMNKQNMSIPNDLETVVPILVTLFIRPYDERVFTFSPVELSQILDYEKPSIKNNVLSVKLDSNIVVNLESFKILNNNSS